MLGRKVHENYDMLPVRSNYILQMHRDLLKFTNYSYGGQFKTTPNEIDMMLGNGEKVVLFKPLEPYETPDAVNMICENYENALGKELVDELILIPCFILDFLCISFISLHMGLDETITRSRIDEFL